MVDVTCPEGDNWREQQRSVVRISVVDNTGAGWCSGSLVNNTNQDCKPYILSAWHCSLNAGQQYDQYIFYFNNERFWESHEAFEEHRELLSKGVTTEKQMHEVAKLSEYSIDGCGFVGFGVKLFSSIVNDVISRVVNCLLFGSCF